MLRRLIGGRVVLAWALLGGLLGLFPLWLFQNGPRFDWTLKLSQIPAAELAAVMVAAGLVYLTLGPLIPYTLKHGAGKARRVFLLVVGFGLIFRAVMMATVPALEDDFYRYLWEGALVANQISPYSQTPNDGKSTTPYSPLGTIARRAGPVLARVNHPELSSIYPPVAQGVFAMTHMAAPFGFLAWRGVCLIGDGVTMLLLVLLLRQAGRSELWSALYWWNPLVLKELINSAHMEAVLMAIVMLALLLSVLRRYVLSLIVLALAIGIKLWPLLLAPLLLQIKRQSPRTAGFGAAMLLLLTLLIVSPFFLTAGPTSGLLAYAKGWSTNSALFPALEWAMTRMLSPIGFGEVAWAVSRGLIGAVLAVFAVWIVRRPVVAAEDVLARAGAVCGALVLLSPAQFPWYMTWMLPFTAFLPLRGLLFVTATTPLYYISFHMIARDQGEVFTTWMVWLIWLPVWLALLHQFSSRQAP